MNEIPGHEEAMKDLLKFIDNDGSTDFQTWEQRFKAQESLRKNKKTPDSVEPGWRQKYRMYSPPAKLIESAKLHGLKFTVGKAYPILAEVPELNWMAGVRYITLDDEGNRRSINAVHFTSNQ